MNGRCFLMSAQWIPQYHTASGEWMVGGDPTEGRQSSQGALVKVELSYGHQRVHPFIIFSVYSPSHPSTPPHAIPQPHCFNKHQTSSFYSILSKNSDKH